MHMRGFAGRSDAASQQKASRPALDLDHRQPLHGPRGFCGQARFFAIVPDRGFAKLSILRTSPLSHGDQNGHHGLTFHKVSADRP
jgi:hypothetical protein